MKQFNSNFIKKLHFNDDGLIPAIAQDWLDGAILMLAWMNEASIKKTIETNEVHYWSRSRKELWRKGSTSGHIQKLKGISFDCDSDSILLTIQQTGDIACHTGQRSCFFNKVATEESSETSFNKPTTVDSCSELFRTIEMRKKSKVSGSYTNKLLEEGDNLILKKIGEEAAEFIMACKDKNSIEVANEAADLIFHLEVAVASQNVQWRKVLEILANRRNAPRREDKFSKNLSNS